MLGIDLGLISPAGPASQSPHAWCSVCVMSSCHPSSSPHMQAASSSPRGARLLLLLDEPLSTLGQAVPMMMVMWAEKTMGPKVRLQGHWG